MWPIQARGCRRSRFPLSPKMMKGDCEMSYGKCVRIFGLVVSMAATGLFTGWAYAACSQDCKNVTCTSWPNSPDPTNWPCLRYGNGKSGTGTQCVPNLWIRGSADGGNCVATGVTIAQFKCHACDTDCDEGDGNPEDGGPCDLPCEFIAWVPHRACTGF